MMERIIFLRRLTPDFPIDKVSAVDEGLLSLLCPAFLHSIPHTKLA